MNEQCRRKHCFCFGPKFHHISNFKTLENLFISSDSDLTLNPVNRCIPGKKMQLHILANPNYCALCIDFLNKKIYSRSLGIPFCFKQILFTVFPVFTVFLSLNLPVFTGWGQLGAGINSAPSSSAEARRARKLNLVAKNREKN